MQHSAAWLVAMIGIVGVGYAVYESRKGPSTTPSSDHVTHSTSAHKTPTQVSTIPASGLPNSLANGHSAALQSEITSLRTQAKLAEGQYEASQKSLEQQIAAQASAITGYQDQLTAVARESSAAANAYRQQVASAQAHATKSLSQLQQARLDAVQSRAHSAAVHLATVELDAAYQQIVKWIEQQRLLAEQNRDFGARYAPINAQAQAYREKVLAEANARIPVYQSEFAQLFMNDKPVVFVNHIEYPSYSDYGARVLPL